MPPKAPWRPMRTAPQTVERIWLNHLTLGPIQAEGRNGRWYAPDAARQVWRWHRPVEPDGLEPFSGWLPFEASGLEPGPPPAQVDVPPPPRRRPEPAAGGLRATP